MPSMDRKTQKTILFTLVEMKTHQYISVKIPDKSSQSVIDATAALKDFYGEDFPNSQDHYSR